MKRFLGWLVVLVLVVCMPTSALAEEDQVLANTAVIVGDTIYYSGSVDGEKIGMFSMDGNGGNVTQIYDADMLPLAYSNGKLLIYSWEEEELLLLDAQGKTIKQLPGCSGRAIVSDGKFFVGNLMIADDGSSVETLFELQEDYYLMLEPIAVDAGYLYYLDQREYGEMVFEATIASELYRVSLADRKIEKLAGAGTSYIGMDDTSIYYTRENFWYLDMKTEQEHETDFTSGLFKINKDGTGEIKLAECGPISDEEYIDYTLFADGVIYGVKTRITEEGEVERVVVRVGVDGVALSDIALDGDTLHAVRDNLLIATSCVFNEIGDQEDKIFAVNLTDLSKTTLNPDGKYMIYFTEEDPSVALVGDKVYFVSYDIEGGSTGLYAAKLDGSGVLKIASGAKYQDDELDGSFEDEVTDQEAVG